MLLGWALFFLMIALIAGTLGFVGLAGITATFFWILSGAFLVFFFVAAGQRVRQVRPRAAMFDKFDYQATQFYVRAYPCLHARRGGYGTELRLHQLLMSQRPLKRRLHLSGHLSAAHGLYRHDVKRDQEPALDGPVLKEA